MAVAVRPVRRPLTALPAPIERAGLAAWPLLAALVSLNVVVRTALGWLRETPIYLGDEYLYAELGRSIAETGRPLVRGAASDFPALLQPIVTAPAWLFGDVGTSYHLVQGMGALAMSLAAIPAFWIARRLGLSKGIALAVAALALALPDSDLCRLGDRGAVRLPARPRRRGGRSGGAGAAFTPVAAPVHRARVPRSLRAHPVHRLARGLPGRRAAHGVARATSARRSSRADASARAVGGSDCDRPRSRPVARACLLRGSRRDRGRPRRALR